MLFADVVDFTRLSERLDPETVREIMDGCFEVLTREIERYQGTVNTFTGDGLMALFGAPVTYEDHAARAVHAAWAIQQAMASYEQTVRRRWQVPFQLRLGLNTGLVLIGQVGEFKMDFTAMGDTVNLAARLQQTAPAGAIRASEATYRAAGPAFRWQSVGPLEFKGKSAAVVAYEVMGPGSVQGRFELRAQRGLTRFVGRDSELDQLLGAWERAEAGHGQVVSVVGEAGLGKSRLLHEFKKDLAKRNTPVYEGSCFAYGEITPYLPFLRVLRDVLDLDPTMPASQNEKMIVARLAERHITSDRAVFIHHLLGLPVEADFVSQLSAPVLRQRTVEALAALIIAEAVNEPTALVIEDVHWIDAASQEVVSAVVEAMTHVPLLLILVYRPEYLHAWSDKAYHSEISLARLGGTSTAAMVRAILSKSYAERVALEHLSAEQSHAMIADLLGTATIPLELERLIATQTDGNPLFIEELTRSLLESGDLVHQGDGYVLGRPAEAIVVPTSVQGVLIERVDRLDPELRTLVQVASVLGRVFAFRLLEAVAPGRGALERQLLELEDLEFMYPTSLTPEREYSFKHVLTQEAVYDTLLRSRREAYHERAGRAIEALYADRLEEFYERLAYHYIRSPNMGKALDYLELANQKAAGAYAMAEAKTYFEQAMQLLDVMPDRPDNRHRRIVLLANQFLVFWLLYQPAEYLELLYRYEAMANDQDDIGLLGTFYKHMGHCQWVFGDMAGALKTLERAVAASEAGGNSSAAGMAYTMFAWTHLELANYQEVATSERKALHAFDRQFNFLDYTWARMALAWAYAQQGRWQDAVSECEDTMRLAYEYRDDSAVSFSYFMLAWIHASWGRVQRAIEFANMALEKAPTPADRCWAQTFMGFSLCRAGQADRAVELLASLVPVYDSAQFMPGVVLNLTPLGEAYWRAGRLEEARQTLEEATDRAERMGLRFYLGWAQRLLGEVTRQSDPTPEGEARAAAHFQRGIDLLREIGAENELALAHAGYGRLCDQRGRTGEAGEHLGRAMEIFERLGTHV